MISKAKLGRYTWRNRWNIALTLLAANQLVITFTGIAYGSYLLLALFAAALYLDDGQHWRSIRPVRKYLSCIRQTKTGNMNHYLLLFLCLPSKYLQVIGLLAFLCKAAFLYKMQNWKTLQTRQVILFFGFVLLIGTINVIRFQGDAVSYLVQIAIYGLLLLLINVLIHNSAQPIAQGLLLRLLGMQVGLGIVQWLYFHHCDNVVGTFYSSHWYGIAMLSMLYYFLYAAGKDSSLHSKVQRIVAVAAVSGMLYLADCKHIVACFLIAVVINAVLKVLKVKKKVLVSWLLVMMVVIGGTMLFSVQPVREATERYTYINDYIYNDLHNEKYQFFSRTFQQMFSIDGFIGYGPGQYGSQINITRAKGVIYDWKEDLSAYTHAIPPYRAAVQNLMTPQYFANVLSMSTVLAYPLVSIIALIAELGVIGFVLLLLALENQLGKYQNATLLILFVLCTIFDTYLEIPCVTVTLLLMQVQINACIPVSEKTKPETLPSLQTQER